MDDFVKEKLQEWNLQDYIHNFENEGIDEESFTLLDKATIELLIPKVGPRLKFTKYLKSFLASAPLNPVENVTNFLNHSRLPSSLEKETFANDSNNVADVQNNISPCSDQVVASPSVISDLHTLPSPGCSACKDTFSKFIDIEGIVKKKLPEIYKKLIEGDQSKINILAKYKINRLLVDSHIQNYDCKPSTKDKIELAKQIVKVFPVLKGTDGEGYEQWFCPGVKGSPSRGFIAERFRNFRTRHYSPAEKDELRIKRIKKQPLKKTELIGVEDTSVEFLQKQQCLKENSQPVDQVQKQMSETSNGRRHQIFENPAISESESQNVGETSTVINQESVECADEPPLPVIERIHDAKEIAASTVIKQEPDESVDEPALPIIETVHRTNEVTPSSVAIMSPVSGKSSLSYSSTPLLRNALGFHNTTNMVKTPAAHIPNKTAPKRKINDSEPNSAPATVRAGLCQFTSTSKPQPTHAAMSSNKSTVLTAKANLAKLCLLTIPSMHSERSSKTKPQPLVKTSKKSEEPFTSQIHCNHQESVECAEEPPLSVTEKNNGAKEVTSSTVIKQEPIECVDEPPLPVVERIHDAKEITTSTVIKQEPIECVDEPPLRAIETVHGASEVTPSSVAIMSPISGNTTSRSSNQHKPAETTKKSDGPSTLPNNEENAFKDMLKVLLDGSNNKNGSKSAESSGDLFDVFAYFIAGKLREMDGNDCAHTLKGITDLVFKAGKSQHHSEVQSDISSTNTSSVSSNQQ